ncbi:PilN domain-containing protein [Pleionea mediterranea]|uniref:Type IV pilus assembly protein PilN n=1 Tax=Pleionea mediterranea TaxID=523701 RepID=A0A316FK90_9GAMM|nr:PilN domain-containing protein [Pleionea mediterranea]PWK48555.1 type IV pilus assembly protein PilN [Pleionea mediterranea]
MARINLLPWREELRKEKQRQFLSILGLVFVLGVVVVMSYKYTVGMQIEAQVQRNNFLKAEIKSLESQIKEIEKLEAERQQLIDRMEMITSLQQSRPKIVHIFDELVKAIPEGLNLKSIERKGNQLIIEGSAESAQRVTSFMRKIDNSEWFKNGNLKDIDSDKDYGAGRKAFSLTVDEKSLKSDKDEQGAGS